MQLLQLSVFISTLLSATVFARNDLPPTRNKSLCNDGTYFIEQGTPLKRYDITPNTCPIGYRLARLENENDLYRAGFFVFGCLGPSKEVWLEWARHLEAAGFKEGQGTTPIKLIAPDAIEKGGPLMLDTNTANVRSTVSLALDKSNSRIHALCQKIPEVAAAVPKELGAKNPRFLRRK